MVREGYLLKQGEKGIKTWKRRWFSIRTGNGVPGRRPHLYYFDKANEVKEKGRVDLEQAVDIAPCLDSPKEFFDFSITTPKRIYRLRAATRDEMESWVEELRKYQLESVSKLSAGSYNEKRKSQMIGSASMKRFPPLSPTSARPQSVMPGFRIGDKKPDSVVTEPTRPTEPIEAPQEKKQQTLTRTNSFTQSHVDIGQSNASQVRQSIRDMRSAALQSEPTKQETTPERSRPAVDPNTTSWGAQEDSKELQTARKRLAKAQNLNSKYENEIRNLRDKVSTLTRENSELQEKINVRDNSVDFDKKRREEELEDLKQKLESEKKLREELNLQYQDVRNELRTLKESIHIVRTAPNIHALTEEPKESKIQTMETPLDKTTPKRSTQIFERPPLDPSLQRSASVSNIGSISVVQKTGDGKRAPWVRDEKVSRCLSCKREFGLFTRKHHCRNCGLIFCADCSSKTATSVKGYSGPERVCDKCFGSLRNAKTAQQKQITRENPTQPRTQGYVPPNVQQATHKRMASEEDPPIVVLDL